MFAVFLFSLSPFSSLSSICLSLLARFALLRDSYLKMGLGQSTVDGEKEAHSASVWYVAMMMMTMIVVNIMMMYIMFMIMIVISFLMMCVYDDY